MSATPRGDRPLRTVAVVLVVAGLALHLWLGTKIPLIAVGVGLACHVVAVASTRHWLLKRR